ncbi:MAG: 50S ribosomal protein L9 [Armatimonadota bacterium]|nr:50S ribosomal protein L9 [Armatimonadota bacterium]MCX7778161.1 50S ribosomal protein L9 [Armatimonadota bacterium]MDW8024515.1 50S ribosomal protein L9 [Armatimonadota bacterium]
MKVILTQDVPKVGKKFDVVEVSDGYARNYLIPKGLAMPATESAMKQREHMLSMMKQKEERIAATMNQLKEQLEGAIVEIQVPAGRDGRLHAAVTSQEIVDHLKRQFGIELDRRQIELEEPLHTIGLHNVPVDLHHGVSVRLKVRVIAKTE